MRGHRTSRMRRVMRPALIAPALALAGCGGSSGDGTGLRLDPLPAAVTAPCPHPSALLDRGGTVASDEISLGRIGDALIDCEGARAVAVEAYQGAAAALAGE